MTVFTRLARPVDELLQRLDIGQSKISRTALHDGGRGSTSSSSTGSILGRVAGDDAVAHGLTSTRTRTAIEFLTVARQP
jgi:hypothetical protein